jgi:hypothetical protein
VYETLRDDKPAREVRREAPRSQPGRGLNSITCLPYDVMANVILISTLTIFLQIWRVILYFDSDSVKEHENIGTNITFVLVLS